MRLGLLLPPFVGVSLLAAGCGGGSKAQPQEQLSKQQQISRLPKVRWNDVEPSWSPDGRRIAFTSTRPHGSFGHVFVTNVRTRQIHALTAAQSSEPAWSPDGKRIAFVRVLDPSDEIYVFSAEGGRIKRLTRNGAFECCPIWSPDGSLIAFLSERDGPRAVYLMRPDGSKQRKLTRSRLFESDPSWSPDGSRIVFESYNQIYIADTRSGKTTQITTDGAASYAPAWAPDGSEVAFESEGSIFLIRPDGTRRRALAHQHPVTGAPVSWSPDGSKIAFLGEGIQGIARAFDGIEIVSVDGSGRRFIPGADFGAWSPDGRRIAYLRFGGGKTVFGRKTARAHSVIVLARSDGSVERRLTQ